MYPAATLTRSETRSFPSTSFLLGNLWKETCVICKDGNVAVVHNVRLSSMQMDFMM